MVCRDIVFSPVFCNWYDTNVSCRRCNRSFFSAKYGAFENQFLTAERMCIVVAVQSGGEGAQTHSLVLYGRNCTWFFLSDMLRFAKQSNKNTIEKVNMGTFILVGRYSGFHGTFDFGIFYFRFQPNTRSKCDTKRPPNELERETIKNSVLKPRTGSEELLKSYKTRFLRLKKKEGV